VKLFRQEPLHERLAREGGLKEETSEDRRSPWDKPDIHGLHRPREWDVVVTADAALEGTTARFVVLGDEIVIDEGPDDVELLADAVPLDPPYRAEARRVDQGVWSVGARRVEVVELPGRSGHELQLVSRAGATELTVDGERAFGSIPPLERDGDYVVRATRLDGDRWEVEASLL
jgi:hypothetical protein